MAKRNGEAVDLEALTRRVRAIERGVGRVEPRPLATGWPALDGSLAGGGLARGAVHEWLGLDDAAGAARTRGGLAAWTPPLFLLAALCERALEERPEGWVLWIGSRVWPYPRTLTRRGAVRAVGEIVPDRSAARDTVREKSAGGSSAGEGSTFELRLESEPEQEDRRLLERSLFLDPPDLAARVWAADAALRCPSIAAVVLEGKGLRVPAGRRLQLAAEAEGGVAFVARAADEAREVSAATTRWRVRRAAPTSEVEGDERPRWELELLRVRAGSSAPSEVTRAG